jgi:hypothetical protein
MRKLLLVVVIALASWVTPASADIAPDRPDKNYGELTLTLPCESGVKISDFVALGYFPIYMSIKDEKNVIMFMVSAASGDASAIMVVVKGDEKTTCVFKLPNLVLMPPPVMPKSEQF